ncbi:MAG: hypothetical protein ACP5U2_16710, partial [Bryobacteraceae bacterium]
MRLRVSFLLPAALAAAAAQPAFFHAPAGSPWAEILEAAGFLPAASPDDAQILVLENGQAPADWKTRLDKGAILILEGESALAAELGIRPSGRRIVARSVEDLHRPQLRIVWEQPLELPVFALPEDARVLARERWERAPLVASLRRGAGAVL